MALTVNPDPAVRIIAAEAAAADCAALAAIHKAAFPYGWEEAPLRDLCLLQGMRLWLAVADARSAGFLLARIMGTECEVITFAVLPAYQNQSVGGQLLEALIAELQHRNVTHCFLDVAEGNETALHLYRQRGFRQTGCRPHYFSQLYGAPRDAISMTLEI